MYSPTFFWIRSAAGAAARGSISGLMIIGWAQPASAAIVSSRQASRKFLMFFSRDASLLQGLQKSGVGVQRRQQFLHHDRISLLRARNRDGAREGGLPLVVNGFDLVVANRAAPGHDEPRGDVARGSAEAAGVDVVLLQRAGHLNPGIRCELARERQLLLERVGQVVAVRALVGRAQRRAANRNGF